MILMIDNYDSFTYNLVQYIGEILMQDARHKTQDRGETQDTRRKTQNRRKKEDPSGLESGVLSLESSSVYSEIRVFRNDKITIPEIEELSPDKIVISPGPGTPLEAGISNDVIANFAGKVPVLAVCLGHQCVGHVFGGDIVRADRLMHGKTSMIYHNGEAIFAGLENPFEATRYHSLIIKPDTLPDCLTVNAWTDQDEIMGVKHNEYPLWGVQFHPESILTSEGKKLLRNFIEIGR